MICQIMLIKMRWYRKHFKEVITDFFGYTHAVQVCDASINFR